MTSAACHPERSKAESKDPEACLLVTQRALIRSLPVRSASGLPVHVAASPAAPFSTSLGMTAMLHFFSASRFIGTKRTGSVTLSFNCPFFFSSR
jgi:hypothetical protein